MRPPISRAPHPQGVMVDGCGINGQRCPASRQYRGLGSLLNMGDSDA